ncbi:uncharacterized protein B0I36DRAFT_364481 [Microdochium trichocladiopsis]|uniref:RING-type E3 ubiquitin transferase n=1 Tax=Microdochium trichocladiopsis TaxID=1682393 RepID=A0A9P9BN11_9PEZI|nr:uncharacterized protein B0I36DRAFT_364481 [Microdochium trichocladiopsis]KAH7027248.1 hypothetical protein B0I36DRAFT_364481 [Microdochium trichocladiopsis]
MDPAPSGIDRPSSPQHDTTLSNNGNSRDAGIANDSGTPAPGLDSDTTLPADLSPINISQPVEEDGQSPPSSAPSLQADTQDNVSLPSVHPAEHVEDEDRAETLGDARETSDDNEQARSVEEATQSSQSALLDVPADDTPSDRPTVLEAAVDAPEAPAITNQTGAATSSDDTVQEEEENNDDDDHLLETPEETPQERRLTLLEALNETRESADHYSSTITPDTTNEHQGNHAAQVDTSPPLPASPPPPPPHARPATHRSTSEFILPRWQPDAEVTLCPICSTQFGIFVRKHHCRKCGRVVCNACSPHRIVIPHQYIVRPPGEYPFPPFPPAGDGGHLADLSGIAGGERVRLCNPCVPDPNMTPPQSQGYPGSMSPRPSHQRSHSSADTPAGIESSSSHFQPYPFSSRAESHARTRSITMNSGAGPSGQSGYYSRSARAAGDRPMYYSASYSSSSADPRHGSRRQSRDGHGLQSAINRPLPPAPQIPEEDECPVCHLELPSRDLPDADARREAHINDCITYHSTYNPRRATMMGSGGAHGTPPPRTERRTGMFPYIATEKDCVDDAECTICFEEYQAGDPMCRLECLCRFHRVCISAWFETHPGRCPVHQHDSYGY